MRYDVVVIGGGPAGMAAALAADEAGAKTLIVERDARLGGILNQCIHQGFGLHYFKEEMTGCEYAERFRKKIFASQVDVLTECMALSLNGDRSVETLSPSKGYQRIEAGAVVLAMGCRERSAGAIALPGMRPAGIYTAGMAQKLCNVEGRLVGKEIVILGSGDIGLIMARRMTLEGAKVKLVLEIMPYSSGLKRNIAQCLDDFGVPIKYSHTITRAVGYPRLEGIYYAPVGEDRKPVLSEEKFVACDALLLSVGLIPENELINGLGIKMSRITQGAEVDENRMTSMDGVFSCGNVLHVHDLVDNVSKEAEIAGRAAAEFARNIKEQNLSQPADDNANCVDKTDVCAIYSVSPSGGVRYALPQRLNRGSGKVTLYFRVDNYYKSCRLSVTCGDKEIAFKRYAVLAPGEMGSIEIDRSLVDGDLRIFISEAAK